MSEYDPRTWLSASQWKAVTSCGRRYELERREKAPSRPAAWTPRGTAVHNTIEEWEKEKRRLDWRGFYEQAWTIAVDETLEKFPDTSKWFLTPRVKGVERDLALRHADGLAQVERYVERALDEKSDWEVIDTEVSFEVEFPDILLRGKIDQLRRWNDGELSLWDIKTGGDDSEDNRQLGIYRFGYLDQTGVDIHFGAYFYTKLDRASDSIDLSVYTRNYLNQELQKVKKILDQGLFLANPSIKNCKFCGVADYCLESKSK
jgi:putative RecB family exonuclease